MGSARAWLAAQLLTLTLACGAEELPGRVVPVWVAAVSGVQGGTCVDDSCPGVCSQQAQGVEVAVVQDVVLKVLQCQGWLQQLPVAVVWEVVVDEQRWVGQEIELVVPGREGRGGRMVRDGH